jgi:hypothetical protein
MTPLYFIWRWTGSKWRPDHIDPDGNPLGEYTEEAALARVQFLMESYQRQRRKAMDTPPVITFGAPPNMKPRKKQQRHRYSPSELNGHTYRRQAVPESHPSR